jgi:GT2 family glycosyltransferase
MSITPYTDCQKNRTAIIVLNWNAPADTLLCLESLLPIVKDKLATMIVCDNHSDDDSVDIINRWALLHFPHVVDNTADAAKFVLFQIESNSGYAAGNNVGIQYALDNDFNYVWILNNDTVVEPDALSTLVDYVEKHPQIACCGSTLVDYSEPTKLQCAAGCQYNPLSTVRTEIYHGCDLSWVQKQEKTLKLDYICGAAMFFNIDALRNIGLMNQQFFLYYEELDLAQRLKKAGYQLGWCKASVVRHQQRSNKKVNEDQQQFLHYHENLSTLIYTWLHHRSIFVFAATFRLIAKIIVLPFTNRIRLLPSLFKAYQDFYLHFCNAPQQQNKIASISNSLFLKNNHL